MRDWGDDFAFKLGTVLAVSISLLVLVIIGYPIYMSMNSDERAEFCYITSYRAADATRGYITKYDLKASVAWGSDRDISQDLPTLEEAKRQAELIGCPLK